MVGLRAIMNECLELVKSKKQEAAIAFFNDCDDYNTDDNKELERLKIEREGLSKAEDIIKQVFRKYIKEE